MTKPISEKELEHLVNFIGYGELDADVWFLGMEEAGGGEDNLRRRLSFRQVEDCAEAHKLLKITNVHWGPRKIQRTWRGMCCIMLATEGKQIDREAIRIYQVEKLGRFGGNTLLTELMPIPSPKIDHWGYEQILPQFESRNDYFEKIKPIRIRLLQELIHVHKPPAIIAHGKKYWNEYKSIFAELDFISHKSFEVAQTDQTIVVLTSQFAHRSMNGKFDELANIISGYIRKPNKYYDPNKRNF